MNVSYLVKRLRRLELNPLYLGETEVTDDIVLDLINLAMQDVHTRLVLKIDILECELDEFNDEFKFPCNFSGAIIDIEDNFDRTQYLIDNKNSLLEISRFEFNKLLIPFTAKKRKKLFKGGEAILYFAYQALPEYIDSLTSCKDCIPNILENALRYYVKYKMYDMLSRTSKSDIQLYLQMYEAEIMKLKNLGVELPLKPRGGNFIYERRKRIYLKDKIHDNKV